MALSIAAPRMLALASMTSTTPKVRFTVWSAGTIDGFLTARPSSLT